MAQATIGKKLASVKTLADLIERLGDIPAERIRFHPLPGTATERDVIAARSGPDRQLCELVDGVLVEKPVATFESVVAFLLGHYLWSYLEENDIGVVLGPDGMMRFAPGLVFIPDVSFVSWDRMPNREFPRDAIARLVPDLAVEILSPSNTSKEMERKRLKYFETGVRLVWIIDPAKQTAEVYTSPTDSQHIAKGGNLDGGKVLPRFSVPLRKLFRKAPRRPHA